MSVNAGAHSVKGGFNQAGGAHFIVISDISAKLFAYTPGTNSGGATTTGTVATVAAAALAAGTTPITLTAGKLIKDMGKSVVVGGVTYRKFQAVVAPTAANAGGQAGRTPEYYSFYLEVGREGQQTSGGGGGPAGIARYF
jgi:hypothetical protein